MAFNPKNHIRKIGNKEYLDTAWRIAWFRDAHPLGRIETDIFTVGDMVAVKAIVMDAEGHLLASGMATVRDANQREATWAGRVIEKAETAAIGRALAVAGFGTQFTGESDGNELADSPREDMRRNQQQKPAPAQSPAPASNLDPEAHGLGSNILTTDEIRVVDIKKSDTGKIYIVAGGVTFFTREPFRALALPKEFIDKMAVVKNGLYLPVPIRIAYTEITVGDKKQRTPVSVMRVDTELEVQVKAS